MNMIDILVLLVLAFGLFAGMYKGFLSSLLSLAALVGSWMGAARVYEFLANKVLQNSTLMSVLSTYLEPDTFFSGVDKVVSGVTANTPVSELAATGEGAVNSVADFIGKNVPFLRDVFAKNLSSEAFAQLNITTVSQYFDQTLWQSIFNVLAFVVAFFVIYFVATLVINLLNHVVRFPVLPKVDWLLGGVLGLARGFVLASLLLAILEPTVSAFSIDLMNSLIATSQTYSMFAGHSALDFLGVQDKINQIIMTGSSLILP